MKKIITLMLSIILAVGIATFFAACDGADDQTLQSISIVTPPTKTSYGVGETFNPAGLVVKATYKDGTSGEISGMIFDPQGPLSIDDTFVTINYFGATVDQPITVRYINVAELKGTASGGENVTLTLMAHGVLKVEAVKNGSSVYSAQGTWGHAGEKIDITVGTAKYEDIAPADGNYKFDFTFTSGGSSVTAELSAAVSGVSLELPVFSGPGSSFGGPVSIDLQADGTLKSAAASSTPNLGTWYKSGYRIDIKILHLWPAAGGAIQNHSLTPEDGIYSFDFYYILFEQYPVSSSVYYNPDAT